MKKYHYPVIRGMLVGMAVYGAFAFGNAEAATVSGGVMTLNLDRDALIAGVIQDNYPDAPTETFPICCRPSLYLEEYFDASAASKTSSQLRDENTPDLYDGVSDEISALGLQLQVNASSLPVNPLGRQNKATTFSFDPANLSGTATGQIGLGGVMRFRVDVDPPNNRVMFGDLDLEYIPALANPVTGQSAWILMNNIGFRIGGFDLFDVSTQLNGNILSLNGILGLGSGFDHLGGIRDTRVGTFSFQTAVVPLPAAFWLFASGIAGLGASAYRKRWA